MRSNLPNILINEKGTPLRYIPVIGGGDNSNLPFRSSRADHGRYIERQLEEAWQMAEGQNAQREAVTTSVRGGVYLEVKGQEGYDLITKSLEATNQHVRLLNVKEADNIISATVYIPNNKKDFFLKKIQKYSESENREAVIGTIQSITLALLESFWIGNISDIPKEEIKWCELWLRYDVDEDVGQVLAEIYSLCERENIIFREDWIVFPERLVTTVNANYKQLETLILESPRIAEIRKLPVSVSFFKDLTTSEQERWAQDLANRVDFSERTNTAICILDTGVNSGHILLESMLADKDRHAVESHMGVDDRRGHGTKMAGIASYYNLQEALVSDDPIHIYHYLESVKMFNESDENDPRLYGDITRRAINLAEIENPEANRSICMAITTDSNSPENGSPTSWSGAIDAIVAGVERDDKCLLLISAGNTLVEEIKAAGYADANIIHSVENPGQAWNAITVGAFTQKIDISDPDLSGFKPVASIGGVSPFTSSSISWKRKWPVKPEIMLEGGNLAIDESGDLSETEDLELLTTSHKPRLGKLFSTISMTSAATAQASYLAANIQYKYPELWPETVRGLLIHSSNWTPAMKDMFLSDKPNRSHYFNLIRMCGYGVPDLNKAIWCADNSVNMIIEDELQPFIKKVSSVTSNEMHIHKLPWPEDVLMGLGETNVKMRVTLSYFIEPGPGEIGWKDKYRYASCGLLFDVNNPLENEVNFVKRISKAMRLDEEDKGEISNDSERWLIGSNNRNGGSIHSDIWEGTASQLSESNMIIVYPIGGWWKKRTNLKMYNKKIRYSLIVTIEAPEVEVDLYTPIITKIEAKVGTKIEVKAR